MFQFSFTDGPDPLSLKASGFPRPVAKMSSPSGLAPTYFSQWLISVAGQALMI